MYRETTGRGVRESDLAKVHGLDTFATKRRTNWGTGTGLSGSYYELNNLIADRASSLRRHLKCKVWVWVCEIHKVAVAVRGVT